jgi:predicted MPP superfamily phosphohydrolase
MSSSARRGPRRQRFVLVLLAATALLQVPFVLATRLALERAGAPAPAALALALGAAAVLLLRGRVRDAMFDRPRPALRRLVVDEPFFVHFCATIGAAPFFVVALVIAWALARAGLQAADRPAGEIALAVYATSLAASLWGVGLRRRWVRVRAIDVPIRGLARDLEGYRIAQLSDLHIGAHRSRRAGERWARVVRDLDVDLVALTGDYVTSGVAFHADIAAVCCAMRGKDGVVAVMGNHDYFGEGEPLIGLLRAGGVTVLRNEHLVLERGASRLTVVGVDDTWTRRADPRRALDGAPAGVPVVALAHDPALFPALRDGGCALVLSGHTHWGQVGLPFFAARWNLGRLMFPYHAGLYRDGDATLYVHPGLGTTGPPVRFGVPPEITVLRLCRA